MPYPLPPFNRREWRSQPPDPGKVYRFDPASGWWSEYGEDGTLSARFQQTRSTAEGIDLEDPTRQMWLTLTATTCNTRPSPAYPHETVMASGGWVDSSVSPYPPGFDKPTTLTSDKDTLEVYLRNLTRITGVPVSLNWSALSLQGITKNQSFGFAATDKPAAEVLLALLTAADRENRLRAVLRATDDGRVAIDITTKQALGE